MHGTSSRPSKCAARTRPSRLSRRSERRSVCGHFSRTGSADRSTTARPCRPATVFDSRSPLARGRAHASNGANALASASASPLARGRAHASREGVGVCAGIFRVWDQPIDRPPLDLVGRPRSLIPGRLSRAGARTRRERGSVGGDRRQRGCSRCLVPRVEPRRLQAAARVCVCRRDPEIAGRQGDQLALPRGRLEVHQWAHRADHILRQ